jgi:hypothetical protein
MKTTFYFLLVSIISFNCVPTHSQDSNAPFVVSPFIGDTLSLEERSYYNMFSTIENFQWAVFYLNPDSTVRAEVTYLRDGILSDTVVYIDKKVESLRLYINARNDPSSIIQPRADNYKGSEIIVLGKNGTETSGNLLVVHPGSILLYNEGCNDEPIDINCVNKFNSSDIQKVIIPGQSNVGWGVGIGLLLGTAVAVTGIILGNESTDPLNEGMTIGITFFSIGVAIAATGTIIGIASSTPDKVIEPFSEDDIKGLSVYSHYPYGEPEELKKIK